MRALSIAIAILVLAACRPAPAPSPSARPIGTPLAIAQPLGLPPVPIPAANPPTAATVALGEKLFASPLLSVDRSISCATCHNPQTAFVDRQRLSPGVRGQRGKRNTPTILNTAYYTSLFWDGRAATLEDQASGPMMNPIEMSHTLDGVEKAVASDPVFPPLFAAAFGSRDVTMPRITAALASYERTLVRANSPFDRYLYGGERNALSDSARRGLEIFRNPERGNCAVCHTIESKHALFTDNQFHNLGVGLNAEGELGDRGRREGDFRTPSLRDVALTAPYMHDGSLKTLKEVVDFYVGGGNSNPHLDREIRALSHLSKQDREDLVAFLESLTGTP